MTILTETAYKECLKRGKLKDLKIENYKKSLDDLDRFYKRKRFKRTLFKVAVGTVIGGVATYFLLKTRRRLDPTCTALGADDVRMVSQTPGYTIGTPSMGV